MSVIHIEVPVSRCIICDHPNDMATDTGGKARPAPGDASICLYCGHVAIFDQQLRLRLPTAEERERIKANPKITRALALRPLVMKGFRH